MRNCLLVALKFILLMDRVADATGIPLDDATAERTADLRQSLGIDQFPLAIARSMRSEV